MAFLKGGDLGCGFVVVVAEVVGLFVGVGLLLVVVAVLAVGAGA